MPRPGLFTLRAARWLHRKVMGMAPRRVERIPYRGAQFDLPVNEDIGWRIVHAGGFEDPELDALLPWIAPDDLCVDVGAHCGIYSVLMARRADKGQVVAVEPLAESRALLVSNLALNGVLNVRVEPAALGQETGTAQFSVSEDLAFSSFRPTGRRRATRTLEVPVRTLDDLFPRQRVGVLKVDVEGAELPVLRGGARLLKDAARAPRALLVELNPDNQRAFGYAPTDVVDFLGQFQYRPNAILPDAQLRPWPQQAMVEDALFLREP